MEIRCSSMKAEFKKTYGWAWWPNSDKKSVA
jgi:hypothetical protein